MLDGFEAAPAIRPTTSSAPARTTYRITVAVAGFGESELSIEAKENSLTIKGEKQVRSSGTMPARCSTRASRRAPSSAVFQLADFVQVKGAALENGLLHVDLVREIPRGEEAAPDRHQRQVVVSAEGGRSAGRLTRTFRSQRFPQSRAPGKSRGAFISG